MRDFNGWLIRASVLVYMAIMALAPVLGLSFVWLRAGFPPNAAELMVIASTSFAVCSALAREVRRRRDREHHGGRVAR